MLRQQAFDHVVIVLLGLLEGTGRESRIGFGPRHLGNQLGGKGHGWPAGHWFSFACLTLPGISPYKPGQFQKPSKTASGSALKISES